MTANHTFNIGDAVLADFGGAQIPGVIEGTQDAQLLVRLAQPWTDETGRPTDTALLAADRLSPLEDETSPDLLPG